MEFVQGEKNFTITANNGRYNRICKLLKSESKTHIHMAFIVNVSGPIY